MMLDDMTEDVFRGFASGEIAIIKLERNAPVSKNFRFYEGEWVGEGSAFKLTGGEFRVAKSGKNKGVFCVLIPGTSRTVYVTPAEIASCLIEKDKDKPKPVKVKVSLWHGSHPYEFTCTNCNAKNYINTDATGCVVSCSNCGTTHTVKR